MVSKKTQAKAGIAERRRGQQMGDERSPASKVDESQRATPALRGDLKRANKYFADDSSQAVGSSGEAPSDNSPSVSAAIPTNQKLGESGGERAVRTRASKKRR